MNLQRVHKKTEEHPTPFGLWTGQISASWGRFYSKTFGTIFCGFQNCFNGLLFILTSSTYWDN